MVAAAQDRKWEASEKKTAPEPLAEAGSRRAIITANTFDEAGLTGHTDKGGVPGRGRYNPERGRTSSGKGGESVCQHHHLLKR